MAVEACHTSLQPAAIEAIDSRWDKWVWEGNEGWDKGYHLHTIPPQLANAWGASCSDPSVPDNQLEPIADVETLLGTSSLAPQATASSSSSRAPMQTDNR